MAERKAACLAYGGGGSSFHYEAPSAPVTCKLLIDSKTVVFEKYYGALFDCNTCNSEEMLQELAIYEGICNGQCRKNGMECHHDYFTWGSYFREIGTIYGNYRCGDIDRSLPGCAESSSSEIVESSSSEIVESSSSEEPKSSSSEENAVNSSDSEQMKSSSSDNDDDDYSSSSGIGERGTECYYGSTESCRSMDLILFKKRPVLLGDFRLYYHKLYCEADGNIVFRANIPVAYYRGESFFCMKKGCVSSEAVEGAWQCDDDF